MDITEHFADQPFTPAMAEQAGGSRVALRHLLQSGGIRRVLTGVYVAASTPDTIEVRAQAATLAMSPHSVVCDRSASWLHGIDVLDFGELDLVPDLEVVSAWDNEPSRRAGILGGQRDLLDTEVTEVQGVRVTTPLRTACDIACLRGRFRALATIDQFRRSFGLTERDFVAMLPRYKGRRGVIQLRELIPLSTDQADSPAESWIRLMIHDAGLPRPEPQVWAELMSLGAVRMENAYAHLRIAVEYDGAEHHTREEDREHDSIRRKALRDELDWYIIVVRKDQLSARSRDEWLRELRREIASRTPYRPGKRVYSRGPDLPAYAGRRRRSR